MKEAQSIGAGADVITLRPGVPVADETPQRCQESVQASHVTSDGTGMLTELIVSGMLDERGIRVRDVRVPEHLEGPLRVTRARSTRAATHVAVWMEVQLPEAGAWSLGSAVLRSIEGEVVRVAKSWPLTPLPAGRSVLVIEIEAGWAELHKKYRLELLEAGGHQSIEFENVEFP